MFSAQRRLAFCATGQKKLVWKALWPSSRCLLSHSEPRQRSGKKDQTGAFSRKFDQVTGIMEEADDFYLMRTPCSFRSEGVRSNSEIVVWPPLEALAEEIDANSEMADELQKFIEGGRMPACYFDHPVVRAAAGVEPVYVYAIYMDGTTWSRVDGALGIWIRNLVTGKNRLATTLRKSEMCACGCRGWCTIYPIMLMLHWSILGLARGYRPTHRHDGSPWSDSEEDWAIIAGDKLGWRAACLALKNDMMEFVTSFGFPSWGDASSPCPCCWATKQDWDEIAGISLLSLPWGEKNTPAVQRRVHCV